MDERLQIISDEQKGTWNRVAYSWKKWDEFTMSFLRPMGDAIIKALDIKTNDVVLDIASGTGEPAFSIAAIAKRGKVHVTDLSEEMLAIVMPGSTIVKLSGISIILFTLLKTRYVMQ